MAPALGADPGLGHVHVERAARSACPARVSGRAAADGGQLLQGVHAGRGPIGRAHAASSRGTSRMKTGRPLPSTVTAERPGTSAERRAERLQHRLLLPEQPVDRQADPRPSVPVATTTARSSRPSGRPKPEQRRQVVHRHAARRRKASCGAAAGSGPAPRSCTWAAPWTLAMGRPSTSSPTRTSSTGCTATVSGSRRVKRVPAPRRLSMLQRAAHRLDGALHRVHPHAAPGDVGDLARRWRPRAGRRAGAPRGRGGPPPASAREAPRATAAARSARRVHPRPSSAISRITRSRSRRAVTVDPAGGPACRPRAAGAAVSMPWSTALRSRWSSGSASSSRMRPVELDLGARSPPPRPAVPAAPGHVAGRARQPLGDARRAASCATAITLPCRSLTMAWSRSTPSSSGGRRGVGQGPPSSRGRGRWRAAARPTASRKLVEHLGAHPHGAGRLGRAARPRRRRRRAGPARRLGSHLPDLDTGPGRRSGPASAPAGRRGSAVSSSTASFRPGIRPASQLLDGGARRTSGPSAGELLQHQEAAHGRDRAVGGHRRPPPRRGGDARPARAGGRTRARRRAAGAGGRRGRARRARPAPRPRGALPRRARASRPAGRRAARGRPALAPAAGHLHHLGDGVGGGRAGRRPPPASGTSPASPVARRPGPRPGGPERRCPSSCIAAAMPFTLWACRKSSSTSGAGTSAPAPTACSSAHQLARRAPRGARPPRRRRAPGISRGPSSPWVTPGDRSGLAQDLLHHREHVLGLERLDDEVAGAGLDGLHHQRLLAERAAHDDHRAWRRP